jgi:hypothetical protein
MGAGTSDNKCNEFSNVRDVYGEKMGQKVWHNFSG